MGDRGQIKRSGWSRIDRCQLIRRGDCCREERDQASNTRRIWACSYGEPLEEGCLLGVAAAPQGSQVTVP